MNKLSMLNSFLFVLLFLTAISTPTNGSKNETITNTDLTHIKRPLVILVTDDIIRNICYQTKDFNLCQHILHEFRGRTLFPEPLARILSTEMELIKSTLRKIVWAQESTRDPNNFSALRQVYNKCLNEYTLAMDLLIRAERSVRIVKVKQVRELAKGASSAVDSCNQALTRQWQDRSGLSEDNQKFYNLNGILLVICNALKGRK
ncbi:invertase inhibitor [Striga asiatica]|uniref:Invertase inhibitor n=1 Tax=Striga asiatica TaxID=4170 RepID=A0A5A7PS06_STRAF|nr:invertase inhibitor [Striga asiatica]